MVPYFHNFFAVLFGANFQNRIVAGTAPSNGAILDELSEQHYQQSVKKDHI